MGIAEDIKQKSFKSEFHKGIINLLYTTSWFNERQNKFFKQYDLTGAQFNVLRILRGQHPTPVTVNLIIERMLDRMSNASRIVDKLEKKNLVKRTQCKNDRRAVDVVISDSGLELLKKMDTEMEVWQNQQRNLTEEESAQLNQLLDKMRA